jgi:hypothetical protein
MILLRGFEDKVNFKWENSCFWGRNCLGERGSLVTPHTEFHQRGYVKQELILNKNFLGNALIQT